MKMKQKFQENEGRFREQKSRETFLNLGVECCFIVNRENEKEHLHVVEYADTLRESIVTFLKSVAIDEFGFKEWKSYLEQKSFEPYKIGGSIFFIVLNNFFEVIATIGGLKKNEDTIKLNSFYVAKNYRNQKIGAMLYKKLLGFALAEHYKHMILCSFDKFDIATNFYKKNGFVLYKNDGHERWYQKELL